MDRGAEVGLGTRHHPTIDHHRVQPCQLVGNPCRQSLLLVQVTSADQLGSQQTATSAGCRIPDQMPGTETGGETGVPEKNLEQPVGTRPISTLR